MKRTSAHLLQLFVTGALAALPLAATIAIFWWAISLLIKFLGPNSAVGGVLVAVGLGVTGSEIVGYLLGIALIVLALVLLGAVVRTGVQRGLSAWFGSLLQRIPVVRTVYDMANKLVGLLAQNDSAGMKSMSAVWVRFGNDSAQPGVVALALLPNPKPVLVHGKRYLTIVVPTAPVPIGGGLLFVPEDWVSPADVGVEALTSIYVSLGVTAGQHLTAAPVLEDQSSANKAA